MIKVISRPFLGKEKYKDFRLCYVDSISETIYEQTPESKAWERTAEYRAIKKRLEEEVKQGLKDIATQYGLGEMASVFLQ